LAAGAGLAASSPSPRRRGSPPTLEAAVAGQFERLCGSIGLPAGIADKAETCRRLLSAGALARPPAERYGGLSRINPNGLPFQWSFVLGAPPCLRFLCEVGPPGTDCAARLGRTRAAIGEALKVLEIARPAWLWDEVLPAILPPAGEMPPGWRSALWTALGASPGGIGLKVYASLERGGAQVRWQRIGRALLALSRPAALERLCAMSGPVSSAAWPVGIAFDILPGGSPGRVKAYFMASETDGSWLARCYQAAGWRQEVEAVEAALAAFPWHAGRPYWPGSLFLSAEFGRAGELTLKTDLALSRWVSSDAHALAGVTRLARRLGLDAAPGLAWLESLGALPPHATALRTLHVVGLGTEADGKRHLNLYCEPPLFGLEG